MLANAAIGAVRTVHSERDDTWVDVEDDFHWLDGGRQFLWLSEAGFSSERRGIRMPASGAWPPRGFPGSRGVTVVWRR